MKKSDFYFNLPSELIAQHPLENRSDSRLMVYQKNSDTLTHDYFKHVLNWLLPNDLLVFNNSKVMKARLFGCKPTGGKVELLVERVRQPMDFVAHIRGKNIHPGSVILLDKDITITVYDKQDHLYFCTSSKNIHDIMDEKGHLPLPTYIDRTDDNQDAFRYQTVYAEHLGSVAAPTAGLHFDESILADIQGMGVNIAHVTLHVGAGTFQPVRTEDILTHKMHREWLSVPKEVVDKIHDTKSKGGRVIAVGTTSLRSMETAASSGTIQPFEGDTEIFIYPGYQFKVCDGLITNFHLPESTLIMLVSALIGHQKTMELYQEAIKAQYRFFSYGDACLFV